MPKPTKTQIALCYIRKSLVRGESDQLSPERQRRNQMAWCHMHDVEPEFYVDAEGHRSGRSEEKRPAWQQLRQQLTRSDVRYVIVETVSRSHRNLKELLQFVDEAASHGVSYVSIQEGFDASTAMGRLALQILGAFAEAWSNLSSEKMQETIQMLRSDGAYWGFIPFGTIRNAQGQLVPDPTGIWWHPGDTTCPPRWQEEQPDQPDGWQWRGYHEALRTCYEGYASGELGLATLADHLNQRGYRYKGNSGTLHPWTREDTRRCLYMWQTYAGNLTSGPSHSTDTEILQPDAWPPLLPLDLIERAQSILATRGQGRRVARPREVHVFELGSILHCARCGKLLEGQTTRHGRRVYRHRPKGACRSVNGTGDAEQIEGNARDLLGLFALPQEWDGVLAAFVRQQQRQHAPSQEEAARLVMLQRRRERLKKLYVEEEIEWSEYHLKKTNYDAEIGELEQRLSEVTSGARIEDILQRLREVDSLLNRASPARRRELLAVFFNRLEVDLDREELTFWPQEWAHPFFQTLATWGVASVDDSLHRH